MGSGAEGLVGVRRAAVTLSGCLSGSSRGRDCCVVCVLYVQFAELYIILGLRLHDRCARDVMRPRCLCGAGKAVCVRAWGVWLVSNACYLQGAVVAGSLFGLP